MDLLGMLKDQVSGTLAGQASKFLGESESSVGKALDGIFPALLGSTIESAKTEGGAGKVLDLLKGMDSGGMDNIAEIFGGGASGVSKLMNQGSGVLNLLLGNKSGGMVDNIAKFAGLRGSSASSLIKMAAPFLMKMIGGHVTKNKLGASGLMDFLGGQSKSVQSSMPSGFASGLSFLGDAAGKLGGAATGAVSGAADLAGGAVKGAAGLAGGAVSGAAGLAGGAVKGVGNVAGNVAGAAGDAAGTAAKAGGGLLKWLLPIVAILAIASYFGLKNPVGDKLAGAAGNVMDKAGEVAGDAAGAVGDAAGAVAGVAGDAAGAVAGVAGDAAGAVGDAAGAVAGAVGGVFGNINEAAKGALDKITFTAGSAGSQMMDYVKGGFKGDANFTFKGLTFASGSANINAATAVEVDNVAAILKAYPDVKVGVTGYTDSSGDAAKNLKLSQDRAQAVKTRLVTNSGIAANRIVTNGLGIANPVGDNSTPAGRKSNRRIEMKIMK